MAGYYKAGEGTLLRTKEDQALWDKVAIAALPAVIRMEYTMADEAKMVEYAARYADAFMAERVKRMESDYGQD